VVHCFYSTTPCTPDYFFRVYPINEKTQTRLTLIGYCQHRPRSKHLPVLLIACTNPKQLCADYLIACTKVNKFTWMRFSQQGGSSGAIAKQNTKYNQSSQ